MRDRLLDRSPTIGAVGVVLVFVASVSTVMLAKTYRPSSSQLWPLFSASDSGGNSAWWNVAQTLSLAAFVLVALFTIVVGWTRSKGANPAARIVGAIAGGGAILAAVVAVATKPLVQWDQLALWAVSSGTEANGYLFAAFDDSVRFILIGGTEVSQSSFATVVVVHLVAPVVATALYVVSLLFNEVPSDIGDEPDHLPAPVLDHAMASSAAPNAELNLSHQTTTDR